MSDPPPGLDLRHVPVWQAWSTPGDPLYSRPPDFYPWDYNRGVCAVPDVGPVEVLSPLDTGWFVLGPGPSGLIR